jgi:hypothetical protein
MPLYGPSSKGAVEDLHKTIKEFNDRASRQSDTMIRLTWVIAVLTLLLFLGLLVQIWLAVRK